MAKSLSELIQLFESQSPQKETISATVEDPLVVELRESQDQFDPRLEEIGDPHHVLLKVKIAQLQYKIGSTKRVLNEQSRNLTRRPQAGELEESLQGERYIIVDRNDKTKNLLPGKTFRSHLEGNEKAIKMGLQDFMTIEEPGSGPPLPSDKLSEAEQQEWDLPFSVDYEEVRDRTGKKVCDCPTEAIAQWVADTLNRATEGEYVRQRDARAETDMTIEKYRNPKLSWFKPRGQ